jgi:hypothetical protein
MVNNYNIGGGNDAGPIALAAPPRALGRTSTTSHHEFLIIGLYRENNLGRREGYSRSL